MADRSKIEWTDRSDWNPVRGCTRVTEACTNCYAEAIAARFSDPGAAYHGFATRTSKGARWTGKVALLEERLAIPCYWRKPARVFPNSMSDFFHEDLPNSDIDKIFAVMALCPHLTFQLLTKRPARMRDYCRSRFGGESNEHVSDAMMEISHPVDEDSQQAAADWTDLGKPLPNVWLGVSVHDQASADEFVPTLLHTPAAIRFVSHEPALEPVDWTSICTGHYFIDALRGIKYHDVPEDHVSRTEACPKLDLIIDGGESGPHARSRPRSIFRSTRGQCGLAGTAYFHKQNGEWIDADELSGNAGEPMNYEQAAALAREMRCRYEYHSDGSTMLRVGKKRAGRLLDGRTHDDLPEAR